MPDVSELRESAERLKTMKVFVAMMNDGRSRIAVVGEKLDEAVRMGAAAWSPEDMLKYVEMEIQHDRDLFRGLKQTFRSTSEWKESTSQS